MATYTNGLALCSGYDGIGLGLSLVIPNYRTVCHVERETTVAAMLAARMANGVLNVSSVWSDIATFDGKPWRKEIHIITAGFPCQFTSSAARGRNVAENLWPYVAKVIREVKPPLVLLENVKEEPIEWASFYLGGLGYSTIYGMFSAEMVGAPHIRERWFSLGYTNTNSQPTCTKYDEAPRVSSMEKAYSQWPDPPSNVRMGYGDTDRLDRLRALGNGVVPAVAALAFITLAKRITEIK